MRPSALAAGLLLSLLLNALCNAGPQLFAASIERADGTAASFQLELAMRPAERRQGLMGRTALPAGQGMIFDFGRDQPLVMWMKNTPLPLDMIFINANGAVVDLITHTTPMSETLLPARRPARYVIELNAGEAGRQAIVPGSRLRLPANFPAFSP